MNRKIIYSLLFIAAFAYGCGGGDKAAENSENQQTGTPAIPGTGSATATTSSDKGIGKFQNVELTHPLDEEMVKKGQTIADVKCLSCHKLTEERLVGPGWKGVTDRHTPEWIMNFVTNVDEMLDKDPKAQAMLEICMVRMPNQNLNDDDARAVLEYMRKVDGKN